jgi:hypothetical protein
MPFLNLFKKYRILLDEDYVTLGSGFGNSKKGAKIESAKRALEVLIPGVEFDEDGVAATSAPGGSAEDDAAVAFFDMLPMEDSRVPEMSAKAGQPTPYLILQVFISWPQLLSARGRSGGVHASALR